MIGSLAFIDEISVKTNRAKTTGWAPRGLRLIKHSTFGHWRIQTFIGALRHDRLDAPWVIDGATNSTPFDFYVETQLLPTLRAGNMFILNNLSSHESSGLVWAVRKAGRCFLFLPPQTTQFEPLSILKSRYSINKSASISAKADDSCAVFNRL